jgi:hypothetical protein
MMKTYLEDATKEELELELKRREITKKEQEIGDMLTEIVKLNGDGHVVKIKRVGLVDRKKEYFNSFNEPTPSIVGYIVETDLP